MTSLVSAFSCDSGDLSTTCYISTVQGFSNNDSYSGNNLIIQSTGQITNTTLGGVDSYGSHGNNLELNFNSITLENGAILKGGNLTINTQNLTLEYGSLISADYLGYPATLGLDGIGLGYSVGTTSTSWRTGGAGHGGRGADGYSTSGLSPMDGGISYGSKTYPTTFGSSAGSFTFNIGGSGGGIIFINATNIDLSGQITSNGKYGDKRSGGGAGGSILVLTETISGNGTFNANGGAGGSYGGYNAGGGSGGRIALYYSSNSWTGLNTSTATLGIRGTNGEDGTIYTFALPTITNESYIHSIEINNAPFTYTLPTKVTGTYNYSVKWGDGSQDENIISWSDTRRSHTFTDNGTYDIVINGVFNSIYYKDVICPSYLEIKQWGNMGLTHYQGNQFFGCQVLNITATDSVEVGSSLYRTFYNVDIYGNLSSIILNGVTSLEETFIVGTIEDQSGLSSWNTSSVTTFARTFQGTDVNVNLNNWDTSKVTNMSHMFYSTPINQDFSSWNFENVTDATNMFNSATLDTVYYDALLNSIASQDVNTGVTFHGGNSIYTNSKDARDYLTNNLSWVITDGGFKAPLLADLINPCGQTIVLNSTGVEVGFSWFDISTYDNNYTQYIYVNDDLISTIPKGVNEVTENISSNDALHGLNTILLNITDNESNKDTDTCLINFCISDWTPQYTTCSNYEQTKYYVDSNNCSIEYDKPENETVGCDSDEVTGGLTIQKDPNELLITIILIFLGVLLILWYLTKNIVIGGLTLVASVMGTLAIHNIYNDGSLLVIMLMLNLVILFITIFSYRSN